MEHFTLEGKWWLPGAATRHVPGTLTFNADGIELVLYGSLREFQMPEGQVVHVGAPEWAVEPVVHGGSRDGRRFTLLEVGGANLRGPFDEVRRVGR